MSIVPPLRKSALKEITPFTPDLNLGRASVYWNINLLGK